MYNGRGMGVLNTLYDIPGLLMQVRMFRTLPESELCRLATICHIKQFEPNEIIFRQGDPADQVWIVITGCVKMTIQEQSGREMIPWIIHEGEPFGTATFLMNEQRGTARALTAAEVLFFPAERFEQLLAAHPVLMRRLLQTLNTRLAAALQMNQLAGEHVERRIAHILLTLLKAAGERDEEGMRITIPLSRQDIADMSGTTLETAIRILSRLRTEGVLRTLRGGFLVILDVQRLEEIAGV